MGNTYGTLFRVTTWGESHGPAMGAVIDGCPAGLIINDSDIQSELDRRKPSIGSKASTQRKENDKLEVLSGIFEGKTIGTPISIVIKNEDHKSEDYEGLKDLYRPGHADLSYDLKYGIRDYRGGGRSSGRETVGRVIAGAIAKQVLKQCSKCEIIAYVIKIGNVEIPRAEINISESKTNSLRIANAKYSKKADELIEKVKGSGDSIGGVIEILIKNPPIGLGEPCFDKLHAELGKALLSIGAVKGFEIGDGFAVANSLGSQNNDAIKHDKNGSVKLSENHCGGILGGISIGEDIILRIAVKPPSSIAIPQDTIKKDGSPTRLTIHGRHDICIVPRIIPVAEAMVALCMVDMFLQNTSSSIYKLTKHNEKQI